MKKLLSSLCLLLLSFSAQAGMTWTAVAVPDEQLPYLRGSEELLTETLNSEGGLYLDKAWGGLHFLLKANPPMPHWPDCCFSAARTSDQTRALVRHGC